jgi:tyrosyl-tRNA synthetase
LCVETQILPSKSEARKMLKAGAININLEKKDSEQTAIDANDLLNEKYIIIRKGKKDYNLIMSE